MRAELVEGAVLDTVLSEWEALYRADPQATPFASPGWARAWLRHYAPDARPWVLLVRDGSRLGGLAALALRRTGVIRMLGGLGQEPGDYWDVLCAPEDRATVRAAVADEVARRSREWDLSMLRCLVPESEMGSALRAAGLRTLDRRPVPCPAISLPSSFDEYLTTLSRSRRSNVRRHLRRLDDGEVQLRELREPGELDAGLERWQRLRARQWDERGRQLNAMHRSARFRAFMLAAVSELIPSGEALVWEFTVDAATVGMYVNFTDESTFYWYLGGFDPAYAQLGVGKIAIAAGIRESIELGRSRYDFTRGSEPYKYWFGAEDRAGPSVVAGSSRLRSRAALAAAGVLSARRERSARRTAGDVSPSAPDPPRG